MKLDLSLDYNPRLILSIVSPSRSGSTIIKHALCQHPDLTSLAGEEEPYYKLAHNGWPWHCDDTFDGVIRNPELIRACIASEVYGYNTIVNRAWLQRNHIEEPPYISIADPDPYSVTMRTTYDPTDILVLKTPQNCYRQGILTQIYPDAEIRYLRITRGAEATVNGLLDGWLSEGMFEARWLPKEKFWWKFDCYPGWEVGHSLLQRVLYQYWMASESTERHFGIEMSYEVFLQDPMAVCSFVWDRLGLAKSKEPQQIHLPELMCTDKPDNERWKIKRPWLADMGLT